MPGFASAEWCVNDFALWKDAKGEVVMLGSGLCGKVYKGMNTKTEKFVAMKVLHGEVEDSADVLSLLNISHENIVKIFAIGKMETDIFLGQYVIVMEYCCHGSLEKFLKLEKNRRGLDGVSYLRLLESIKSAYLFLDTKNIYPRDIKPINILVSEDMDGKLCFKLADLVCAYETRFGYFWQAPMNIPRTEFHWHPRVNGQASQLSATGTCIDKEYVDMWSIGVTLYEAATGQRTYQPVIMKKRNLRNALQAGYEQSKPGVICMRENPDGEWEQFTQLPENMQMSKSLGEIISPLIAHLMCKSRDLNKTVHYMTTYAETIELIKKHLKNGDCVMKDSNCCRAQSGGSVCHDGIIQLPEVDVMNNGQKWLNERMSLAGKRNTTATSHQCKRSSPSKMQKFACLDPPVFTIPPMNSYKWLGMTPILSDESWQYASIDCNALSAAFRDKWGEMMQKQEWCFIGLPPLVVPPWLVNEEQEQQCVLLLWIRWFKNQLVLQGTIPPQSATNWVQSPKSIAICAHFTVLMNQQSIKNRGTFSFQQNDISTLFAIHKEVNPSWKMPIVDIQVLPFTLSPKEESYPISTTLDNGR